MRDSSKDLDKVGPIGAEHTEEDGEIGVWRVDGHIVFVPRSYRRLSAEGKSVIGEMQEQVAHISQIQAALAESVTYARDLGVSWDLIGWSVGTTGNAARQRWGLEH
jgi:hypothetical protein